MVATRRLERRAEMRAGSSPVVRTICRSVGMVDKEVSKTFAETRVGSSPIFGTSEVV